MKNFIVIILIVCTLAVVEGRRHRRHREKPHHDHIFRRFFRYMDEEKATGIRDCVDKCAAEANVSLTNDVPRVTFPSAEDVAPLCQIQNCIAACDKDETLSHFVLYICEDAEYAASVQCLNDHYINASTSCLLEYFEKKTAVNENQEATTIKPTEKPTPKTNLCAYVHALTTCMAGKYDGVCGEVVGKAYSQFATYVLYLVDCW